MVNNRGKHIIQSLRKRWAFQAILYRFLLAISLTVISASILHAFAALPLWWGLPFLVFIFILLLLINLSWKIKETDVIRYLDQTYPLLEESCGLLMKPNDLLNRLEQLQVEKTEYAILNMPSQRPLNGKLALATSLFIIAGIAGLAIIKIPVTRKAAATPVVRPAGSTSQPIPEKIPAGIAGVLITIRPPAYTSLGSRTMDKFNLEAEEGAGIHWQLRTTAPVPAVQFIFNDSLTVTLRSPGEAHTIWMLDQMLTGPGYYQVKTGNTLSEMYKMEMIKDQPPSIHIQTPKPYTTLDFTDPQKVRMVADISDDYGIQDAYISATVANGSGEAVKFKEQKLTLPGFIPGSKKYTLEKWLFLSDMGMHPGDELYFYVFAMDNHKQESRSDVYQVTIQDTTQLMSLDGLTFGINIKPEYFRSERQIIMETEQLLKDKSSISETAFKNKSNDLGIDQKLLRLRYGKFLGEESETDIPGGDEDVQKALSDPGNFGNAGLVLDKFTDKHDNSEDASFFDPQTKKQLKATLTEMWNAELQLRTFKPQEAIAYEYKALRLLKDLQQKSRAYVAKSSFKTVALKPEKRLTGDLGKIAQTVNQQNFNVPDSTSMLRTALGVLEQLKTETGNSAPKNILLQASHQLNSRAVSEPSIFLQSAQAMKKVLAALDNREKISSNDLAIAENGLQHLLTFSAPRPGTVPTTAGAALSRQYFNNLSRGNRKP